MLHVLKVLKMEEVRLRNLSEPIQEQNGTIQLLSYTPTPRTLSSRQTSLRTSADGAGN